MRCSSYCIAKEFNSKELHNYYSRKFKIKIYENVMHIKLSPKQDVFIIYGAIIFWNVSKRSESYFIRAINQFAKHPLVEYRCEELEFEYSDQERINLDVIQIRQEDEILSKIAVSLGLAQSSMLEYFEEKVDVTIDKYEDIVLTLANKGKIPMSNKDVFKKLGNLFLVRNEINMQSDILDHPLFIWNNPECEKLYKETIHNMNLASRTSVLNKRLDIMQDLFDILNNQITSNHSSRLEWIIIWLIFIEIIISIIFHYKI